MDNGGKRVFYSLLERRKKIYQRFMTTEHLKSNNVIFSCKEGMGRVYVLVVCSRSGVSSSLQQNISRLAPAGGAP